MPVKKIMVPLNVTLTAIVDRRWHRLILDPGSQPTADVEVLPLPKTPLRHMLSSLVNFVSERYKKKFKFAHGGPIHDALTIAYVAHPELFTSGRYHVDVELAGMHTVGETVVDMWDYEKSNDSWGRNGKNCIVAESLNVSCHHLSLDKPFVVGRMLTAAQVTGFFKLLLDSVSHCDMVSPLNKA
jgi:uridine nucleosidase